MPMREAAMSPFPIRKLGDGWEVVFIDQGEIPYCVTCETRDDAEAVANVRMFNAMFECRQLRDADAIKVRQCQKALAAYGLQSTLIYRRMGRLLEDIANLGAALSGSVV